MTATIATLEAQLKSLEEQHAAALAGGNIGGATDLARKIGPLADLLAAPARKAAALRDLEALKVQADQAQGVVAETAQVAAELQARHAEAVAQISEDRALTASAILAAAKRGETIAACSPDRGPATALEAALALAEAEHQAAVGVLAAVQEKVAAGEQALCFAERDCAGLVFEMALRDFAKALRGYTSVVVDYSIDNAIHDIQQRFYVEE